MYDTITTIYSTTTLKQVDGGDGYLYGTNFALSKLVRIDVSQSVLSFLVFMVSVLSRRQGMRKTPKPQATRKARVSGYTANLVRA